MSQAPLATSVSRANVDQRELIYVKSLISNLNVLVLAETRGPPVNPEQRDSRGMLAGWDLKAIQDR